MRQSRNFLPRLRWTLLICGSAIAMMLWINARSDKNLYKLLNEKFPLIKNIYTAALFHYVDEIDHEEFFEAAVSGMLNTLDPYTAYLVNENRTQLQILTDGNYGGVGLPLQYRDKIVTVSDPPFIGTPAARAGLHEGDIILEVDDVITRDLDFDDTANRIRGKVGTEVTLKIRRAGESKPLTFRLVRDRIKVIDVRFSGMINDEVGYINLTRFSSNVGKEVKGHIEELKALGMKKLIFDLRSNPGGILGAGIEVSDLFLAKGKKIVSTRGRSERSHQTYDSPNDPVWGKNDGELIVLVNRFSASASEIVAGAIQDNDRAVVVGDTTFGKGLVQSVFNLPSAKNATLKMTTAKYYTPSGRCIQKRQYSNWSKNTSINKDKEYKTAAGRSVYGGGGIAPDLCVELPLLTAISVDMRRKSLFFNFAVKYANAHPGITEDFEIDQVLVDEFRAFLKTRDYEFKHPIEAMLDRFKEEIIESGYNPALIGQIESLEAGLKKTKDEIFEASRKDIALFLRQELNMKYFGVSRATQIGLSYDPVITKSMEILMNKELYLTSLK
ncbi:S41 family peptidase [bacterium]|nr:S41 family peptidase [bacterium]